MFKFLKHLLIPHSGNNHRAKILHHSSLAAIILLLFFSTFVLNLVSRSYPEVLGMSYSISESDLLSQVNAQRASHGLSPLSLRTELDDAARRKASDMFQKNYWAHFAPDGTTSPWEFIKAAGYNYQFAGENLAKGFSDPSSVVTAWMNSETHRANILSDKYKDVGFAIVPGTLQGEETVLIVQMFGTAFGQNTAVIPVAAAEVAASKSEVTPTINTSPSPEPTVVPVVAQEPVIVQVAAAEPEQKAENKPKLDAGVTTRAATSAGLTLLAFGFVMDLVIVERKKIPRIVGHNLDHLILIIAFIIFIVIMRGGVVL